MHFTPKRFILTTKTSEEDLSKLRGSAQKMRLILFALLIGGGIFLFQTCTAKRVHDAVQRHYDAQALEYKVTSAFEYKGEKYKAEYLFKLGELQNLEGTAFSYDMPMITSHGEDLKLYYLPPDKLEYYKEEYLKPGKECPASFMHHNQKVYLLVGANDTVSQALRSSIGKFDPKGTSYSFHGHFMNYDSSMLDGKPARLLPAMNESGYSNVGFAKIPYEYFLVTGIGPIQNDGK